MSGTFTPVAPFNGKIRVPGSKSITIRALVAAALAEGRSHIYGPLRADDTNAMVQALRGFGVVIEDRDDPWMVVGSGGYLQVPNQPIQAGGSGLTARIAIALAALVEGSTTIDGSVRLRQRPVGPLLALLESQGVEVESDHERLPVTVHAHRGLWGGEMTLGESPTSQLVTAALLITPQAGQPSTIKTSPLQGSGGYVDLTMSVMAAFGAHVGTTILGYEVEDGGYRSPDFTVEPDVSAAVYPLVAAAITGSRVELEGLRDDSLQPDMVIAGHLASMGCEVGQGTSGLTLEGPAKGLDPIDADLSDAPDGAMALAVASCFANGESRIGGLGSLRFKESDRLEALVEGLTGFGASVGLQGDDLVVSSPPTRGGVFNSYGDHRVAMSLSLVGLMVGGVEASDPGVVSKTWPSFWEDMSALVSG